MKLEHWKILTKNQADYHFSLEELEEAYYYIGGLLQEQKDIVKNR